MNRSRVFCKEHCLTVFKVSKARLHLINRWEEGEELAVAATISGLVVETIQLLRAAEAQEALHTPVRLQGP